MEAKQRKQQEQERLAAGNGAVDGDGTGSQTRGLCVVVHGVVRKRERRTILEAATVVFT
jgi:hypothetical protein